ncbi:hypothetical protein EB796_007055 [Bugula neritina]|uniref:Uncharacterized protein n=1 Tax=Bugula neritina TaxID=10212 RepID=A0A7J7K8U4_BUGNE|nr:hypothetical protein EB796_007055 [Bugula neritina]
MSNQLKMTDISDSESSLEVAHQVAVDSTANTPPGAAKLYVHVEIPQDEFAASDVLSSQDSKLGKSVGSDSHIVYSSGASENLNSTNSSLSTDSLAGKTDNKDISSVLEQSLKGWRYAKLM